MRHATLRPAEPLAQLEAYALSDGPCSRQDGEAANAGSAGETTRLEGLDAIQTAKTDERNGFQVMWQRHAVKSRQQGMAKESIQGDVGETQ